MTTFNPVAERAALRTELARLRDAFSRENNTISQVLGRALGYPRFADDQKNFPGATDANGVCVGDHVAASLADEAANVIRALKAEVETLSEQRWRLLEACDTSDDCYYGTLSTSFIKQVLGERSASRAARGEQG